MGNLLKVKNEDAIMTSWLGTYISTFTLVKPALMTSYLLNFSSLSPYFVSIELLTTSLPRWATKYRLEALLLGTTTTGAETSTSSFISTGNDSLDT